MGWTWAWLRQERDASGSRGPHHREPVLHHRHGLPPGLPVHRGCTQWCTDPCGCEYTWKMQIHMHEHATGTPHVTLLTSETTKISLFSPRRGHRNHYFVHWSLSTVSDIEWEIDPLFCLAENWPLQLLTGYSNTGRAGTVPLCAALFEYTRNSQPASMHICTRSCRTDSPAVGPGPGPSLAQQALVLRHERYTH